MKLLSVVLVAFFFASTISIVEAGTVIFEAGPFAIIMDKDTEIMEIGNLESWDMFGFEPVKSRELAKENYYKLQLGSILVQENSGLVDEHPMFIEIAEEPLDGYIYLFTPTAVGEVTVGKINPVNTTLYTGKTSKLTPYFTNYTSDGIYCRVYDPIGSETSMIEFLNGFSVIRKKDLGKCDLSKLWSED